MLIDASSILNIALETLVSFDRASNRKITLKFGLSIRFLASLNGRLSSSVKASAPQPELSGLNERRSSTIVADRLWSLTTGFDGRR